MKNIIKYSILLIILIFTYSCILNFQPKSDNNLHKQYKYSEKAEDIIIFYNIQKFKNSKIINISFKNKSNFFMTNVAIKVTSPLSTKSDYFSLGNIKNGNSKTFSITINKDINELTLNYEYYLSREDAFLKSESYIGQVNTQSMNNEFKKTGRTILFIK